MRSLKIQIATLASIIALGFGATTVLAQPEPVPPTEPVAQPVPVEPAQPAPTQPAPTQPPPTQPPPTQPAPTQPPPTPPPQPRPAQAQPAQPRPAEPPPTQPVPAVPAEPTQPTQPTQPVPAEPTPERPSPDMVPPSGNPHAGEPAQPGAAHTEPSHAAGGEHAVGGHGGGHGDHPAIDNSKYINWFGFDYGDKDIYGGPIGDGKMTAKDVHGTEVTLPEEEKMSPPFIFMLINFGLLLIILGKYAAPAARKLAEERHDLIKNALDEAAKLRKQAQEKLTEYESRLKDADKEIKALVEGLRTDAEADKQRILAQAAAQAALLKKDAELRIAAEIATARAQLTKEVTAAATAATEKLLRDQANADDQNKLVATFIADVQQAAIRNEGPR